MTLQPPKLTAAMILTQWRSAMRQRQSVPPGSPEADRVEAVAEELYEAYHALADEAVRRQEPSLPAFPATYEPDDDQPSRGFGRRYADGR